MRNTIEYNCGHEELIAISLMDGLTLEQKVDLGRQGISFSQAQRMLGRAAVLTWEKELEWENNDVDEMVRRGHVFYGEDDYPESLSRIENPPFFLAWKGSKPAGCDGNWERAESLTIVGTRRADGDGMRAAYLLALECAVNGIAVYSGYATGIDQSSHLGASDGEGRTFAVMPCGLAHSYAYRERKLAKSIYDFSGGFLSQFTCDEEPRKWNFHYRNRILAAISDATVVTQAPSSSGALITATDALDCGKDCFVHTAGLGSGLAREGTQRLANDGAIAVSCLGDLSAHTFGSFACSRKLERISYEQMRSCLASDPPEAVWRYADGYYRFVERGGAAEA